MDELQRELAPTASTTTTTIVEPSIDTTRLADLPSLEELTRSENEVVNKPEIKGFKSVVSAPISEDRTFKRKADEKKVFLKKRQKLVTAVYISVASLLLAFVGINIATLAILNKDINTNANTIQIESVRVENAPKSETSDTPTFMEISLNEPRDYGDDNKELTFLDKVTILFRNIFG